MVKIGYANHPRKDIFDEIKWVAENNFDFVDLFLEPDACDLRLIKPNEVKALLENFGLDNVGHTAWYLPIGSAMKDLRIKAVETIKAYFDVFQAIGCRKVTVHANWPGGMFTGNEGVDFQIESLAQLVSFAKNSGIKILFESVTTMYDNKENLSRILSELPDLAFHADIGHLNLCGRDPAAYLLAFKDRLEHVHMHDNDGTKDQHLPIGVGYIDWQNVIKVLKSFYDKTITLEIFSLDRDYVLLSRKKLLEMWEKV